MLKLYVRGCNAFFAGTGQVCFFVMQNVTRGKKKKKKRHGKFRVQIFFGLLIKTKGHTKQQKHWQLNKQQIPYMHPNKKSLGVWNVLTSCF